MKSRIIHTVCLLILSACYVDDQNTFVSDPFDPRVPQYTEEGANTAGAYVDDEPWVIRKNTIYSGFDPSGYTSGTLSFLTASDSSGTFIAFRGGDILRGEGLSDQNCSVGFFLGNILLMDRTDLVQLNGQRIDPDGIENFGQVVFSNDFHEIGGDLKGTGILFIRNINRMETHYEISGTFGFTVNQGEGEINVFSGRFDYEVFDEQFGQF